MVRKLLLCLAVVLTTVNLSAGTRYIVALKGPLHGAHVPLVQDAVEAQSHDVRQFDNFNSFAADLTEDEVNALRRSSAVRYVEPVVERHLLDVTPGSPRIGAEGTRLNFEQTVPPGITTTRAPELWNMTKSLPAVNVAVLDTGIDPTHPDLKANYAGGYNTFDAAVSPADDHGHGSHVAGTIAAANNSIGVVGMYPTARLWALKVLDNTGAGTTENVVAALNWLISKKQEIGGNWVASLSLGSKDGSASEQEAFQRAFDAGILSVAAAGNTGLSVLEYPGAYPTVVSAGAVDASNVKANFSSYGANIALMAPGVAVLSTTKVGTNSVSDVQTEKGTTYGVTPIYGTPRGDVQGPYVDCGIGNPADFPPSMTGRIAVIQRGCGPTVDFANCNFTFNDKVKNAMAVGAAAVIIYNIAEGQDAQQGWTLVRRDCVQYDCTYYQPDLDFPWVLTLAMSYEDGLALLKSDSHTISESYRYEDYKILSGTSMSTPHVSGGAALIWSLAPNASAQDVRSALTGGAKDLAPTGYDAKNGYGLLDVVSAAKILAPGAFGLPDPQTPRRRPNG
ncbi:MAG TPA: S8 family serine peptidase [Thermoanaerobaculia bacterium]|nr:S8 family serine peptidase [Thermoanaerobaculia bacterium]